MDRIVSTSAPAALRYGDRWSISERDDALELCGSATIEHVPETVVVMPDPPRLVYSTRSSSVSA